MVRLVVLVPVHVLVRRWLTVVLVFLLVLMCVAMFVSAMTALPLVLVLAVVSMGRLELKQGRLRLVLEVRLEMERASRSALLFQVRLQGVVPSHWADHLRWCTCGVADRAKAKAGDHVRWCRDVDQAKAKAGCHVRWCACRVACRAKAKAGDDVRWCGDVDQVKAKAGYHVRWCTCGVADRVKAKAGDHVHSMVWYGLVWSNVGPDCGCGLSQCCGNHLERNAYRL